jgi:hypothetical protein
METDIWGYIFNSNEFEILAVVLYLNFPTEMGRIYFFF